MLDKILSKCSYIISQKGHITQHRIAMEECAELIQAISKIERYGEERKGNLTEEIADVLVMIIQLCMMHQIDEDEVNSVMLYKLNRQIERIKNEK